MFVIRASIEIIRWKNADWFIKIKAQSELKTFFYISSHVLALLVHLL